MRVKVLVSTSAVMPRIKEPSMDSVSISTRAADMYCSGMNSIAIQLTQDRTQATASPAHRQRHAAWARTSNFWINSCIHSAQLIEK
jgi:hypothetical protein